VGEGGIPGFNPYGSPPPSVRRVRSAEVSELVKEVQSLRAELAQFKDQLPSNAAIEGLLASMKTLFDSMETRVAAQLANQNSALEVFKAGQHEALRMIQPTRTPTMQHPPPQQWSRPRDSMHSHSSGQGSPHMWAGPGEGGSSLGGYPP